MAEEVWESLAAEGFTVRADGRPLLLEEAGVAPDAQADEYTLQALQAAFLDVRCCAYCCAVCRRGLFVVGGCTSREMRERPTTWMSTSARDQATCYCRYALTAILLAPRRQIGCCDSPCS